MAQCHSGSGLLGDGHRWAVRQRPWTLEASHDQVFQLFDLSPVEFDILATIRRNNTEITPTELYQTLMLSSGAISTRIEQLVQRGFVQRIANDQDRRSCKVTLTEQGQTLIDQALNSHVDNMNRMLAVHTEQEQRQLEQLLKKFCWQNKTQSIACKGDRLS